jgi:hypothetical protein
MSEVANVIAKMEAESATILGKIKEELGEVVAEVEGFFGIGNKAAAVAPVEAPVVVADPVAPVVETAPDSPVEEVPVVEAPAADPAVVVEVPATPAA